MLKKALLSLVFLVFVFSSEASKPDSTILISSAEITYKFLINSNLNTVEIREKSSKVYQSTSLNSSFTVYETYNDQVKIDETEFKLDGKIPFNFKPQFTYHSTEGIFYSDARICYFPVSFGKIGSIAKVKFEKTTKDPRYFTSIYFPEEFKTLKKEISIIIPRWMKAELKEMNFDGAGITKNTVYDSKQDADIITFSAQNIAPVTDEDNSPGPTYLYPHILVLCKSAEINNQHINYFNTLADQYAWYRDLLKNFGNNEEVLKAKADEITKGLKSDLDKIKAIFYYVQKEVRYIAFENGIAGFKPEKADEVLRKKYGDCKGMAHLTKELLKASGYDARLCWIGTKHIAYDYKTPSMAVDNHMICALIYQNKTWFLDATESYIGFNEYAERIQGRQVLIENGDKYILSKVPEASASQNLDYEKRVLSINGTSLTGKASHQWKGEEKEFLISGINRIKKDKSSDALIKYLSNNSTEYEVKNLNTSDVNNLDTDLTASYDVDHKNAVNIFSKQYYIDIDFRKEFQTMVIDTADRKHDFWFDYKTSTIRETELIIPENYEITSLPPNLDIKTPGYEFSIQFTALPGKMLYKKTILLKNPNISKADFKQWNSAIEKLKQSYTESLILKPKS